MSVGAISSAGTSIWLDDLSRAKIAGSDKHSLPHRIAHDGVVGVTTNPSIFSNAISQGAEYAADIEKWKSSSVDEVVRVLTTDDVRAACDLFAPIFHNTSGIDGRVSIEVDPRSARNTAATISEGELLWKIVARPNTLIKVPATLEGLPAITALIAQGISVNVTLIFSVDRYKAVMDAFIAGLEKRVADGLPLTGIASVASFFISRIDTAIDQELKIIGTSQALELCGKSAIANAVLAYEAFLQVEASARWQRLHILGASLQRPLWASTGVKDPAYDDTQYVMQLLDTHTVNTMPQATLDAVIDHGADNHGRIRDHFVSAKEVLAKIDALGINLGDVTEALEIDGVMKFEQAWNELLSNVSSAISK